ncbi:MAG TPA: SGNH/GDSL hydrolase family protein [Streptosporangiaceae bacterium]|nr:SGNH/GDSL hydrolase family protein [Streptosporangiaceae bacterium]
MTDLPADGPAEATDQFCLSDAQADELLAKAPWDRFLVMGDSLAEGLGEASPGYRSLPWADRTREALTRRRPGLTYLNIGLRNLVAAEVREQQLARGLEFAPDLAAVVCGGNDLFAQDFDPDAVERELDTIIGSLRQRDTTVITYCLMNIIAAYPELDPLTPKIKELNDRVRAVADRHGALLVDMWDHPGCAERTMYSSDLLHSSMRGHALLAGETIRRLGRHLAGD